MTSLADRNARRQLRDKAEALFRRFNEAFWDEETGFYAFMLDGDKRKVLTRRIQSRASACGPASFRRTVRSAWWRG